MAEYFSPLGFALTVAAVALCVGSFLNVVIYRLPKMLMRGWRLEAQATLADVAQSDQSEQLPTPFNLMVPRSHCPSCGRTVRSFENIPVLSWLALRGRCAGCKSRISIRYPLVESATAILSVAVALKFGVGWTTLAAIAFTWTLVALTMVDFDTMYLPDVLTLPLLWLGLVANQWHAFVDLPSAVWGAVAGYLSLWSIYWLFKLVTGKEGMGYGDFKLLAAIGAWLGWQALPAVVIVSSLVGSLLGLSLIVFRGRDHQVPMPFGPFLASAGWIVMMWGGELQRWYLDTLVG